MLRALAISLPLLFSLLLGWGLSLRAATPPTLAKKGIDPPESALRVAVRSPPPKGAHHVGRAVVWAPWSAMANALPGPAPLSVGVITMLHGACGAPLPVCAPWSQAGESHGWLVCPDGNATCSDGALDWRGTGEAKATHLDHVRASVEARYGAWIGRREILVGFSRGAFAARDVAYARPGRYRALVLIGAAIRLDPLRLRASGIERIALVSGQHDGARPTMVAATAMLSASGLSARFFDAGPVYHQLPPDMDRLMGEVLGWIDG